MGSHYAALEAHFKRLGDVEGASAILGWDTAVMMPRGSAAVRGEQLATLKGISHEMLIADTVAEGLDAALAETDLDPWRRANLREMRRRHRSARAVDPALVEALTRACTACETVWREARAASDFAMLRGHLEEVVALTRATAVQTGAALGLEPYDALLEANQPDLRDAAIEPLFGRLGAELPTILDLAITRQAQPLIAAGPFPIERQKLLAKRLMERMGFDFTAGRLDESTHPFCGGVPSDIRLTTRYRQDEIVSAMMGVLHETGHALYEAGLPRDWQGQPVGEARGIVVHESQSLLVEMQASRSPSFLAWLAGELRAEFGDDPALTAANLKRTYHRVARSLIRVDADEVTYPLHIVLRHRLERHLIAGDLAVADLPGAWNDGMRELLGVVSPDDARGCLQDIHWPVGAFGYFPCYTLGAVLAAQLFAAARASLPDLEGDLATGDFAPLLGWLRAAVHGRGSLLGYGELVEAACGAPLTVEPFLAHLRARYLG